MKVDDDTFVHLEPFCWTCNTQEDAVQEVYARLKAGVPIRDDKHKNHFKDLLSTRSAIPYPHGAHYVVTRDFVSYIVKNEDMLASSIVPRTSRKYRGCQNGVLGVRHLNNSLL